MSKFNIQIQIQKEIFENTVLLSNAVAEGKVAPEDLTYENVVTICHLLSDGEVDGKPASEELISNPVLLFAKK